MTAQGRTAQRAWLLEHFPADLALLIPAKGEPYVVKVDTISNAPVFRCCRCYRCGKLLVSAAIFPDKVDPNGTTRRSNLRPACREHVGA